MEINVFMQKLQIKHKTCYIDQNGSDGPIILWGMYPHRGNEIAHMWECLMETVNDQDFLLCAFQVEDWNGDFSPWKAPAAFGDEDFKGNGLKTLQWLTNDLIPELKTAYGADREIYLIGYSLAGLFAYGQHMKQISSQQLQAAQVLYGSNNGINMCHIIG